MASGGGVGRSGGSVEVRQCAGSCPAAFSSNSCSSRHSILHVLRVLDLEWTRDPPEPLPREGNPQGQGHRAAAARGQLRRTCTLDTRCCAVPQNGPNLPMSSRRSPKGCPVHSTVSGSTLCTPWPAATSVSQLRPTVRADVVRWPLVENHCLWRRHDQGQPSGAWPGLRPQAAGCPSPGLQALPLLCKLTSMTQVGVMCAISRMR